MTTHSTETLAAAARNSRESVRNGRMGCSESEFRRRERGERERERGGRTVSSGNWCSRKLDDARDSGDQYMKRTMSPTLPSVCLLSAVCLLSVCRLSAACLPAVCCLSRPQTSRSCRKSHHTNRARQSEPETPDPTTWHETLKLPTSDSLSRASLTREGHPIPLTS